MLYRCIAPDWLLLEAPGTKKVLEGHFTDEQRDAYNADGYNVYWLPNSPSVDIDGPADGTHIDTFDFIFVDMDLKDGKYTKEEFVALLKDFPALLPTQIVDSGNGIHAYWQITDLDAMSYLRLSRRLVRKFKTDEAVGKLYQLMRMPGTYNTKSKGEPKLCEVLYSTTYAYTCEEVDRLLPRITPEDEEFCKRHYDQTYGTPVEVKISEKLPLKFARLLKESNEVKELYAGDSDDRSKDDYRLAHILFAEGFKKEEALSVLVNCKKALSRSPHHRANYALNIADKVWTYENSPPAERLSNSVGSILRRGVAVKGERLPCHAMFDGTDNGFRLTQVLGLIGGAGSGKTTLALNYFWQFVKKNPSLIHVFVSLEQPEEEIAIRWDRICEGDDQNHEKVHVLGNYNADGTYRNLSLYEIEDYILALEAEEKVKVGCVVIDHIGVLKKQNKDGENQGLIDICHHMKAFAKNTNTFLVMQSQTTREKAGIGDLELDKDAAYGTSMFEWYCDFVLTTWQPLKRIYKEATHMTCSAFKYCKIRHKNVKKDKTLEDSVHVLMYDTDNEQLRLMNQNERRDYGIYNKQATELRNKDRKREPSQITHIEWAGEEDGNTTRTA